MEDHVAQVAAPGTMRVWAEPETGGEAYIPLAPAKRARSTAILASVAKDFGSTLVPFDARATQRSTRPQVVEVNRGPLIGGDIVVHVAGTNATPRQIVDEAMHAVGIAARNGMGRRADPVLVDSAPSHCATCGHISLLLCLGPPYAPPNVLSARAAPGARFERVFESAGLSAMTATDEQVALLALTEASPGPWYDVSDLVEQTGSALAVAEGHGTFLEARDRDLAEDLARRVKVGMYDHWRHVLDATLGDGQTQLVTVLDDGYPANLRRVYNRPPFLFIRGHLAEADDRSVAVVGTRKATERGVDEAGRLATALAQRGVTVISGLAAGIDTTAHTAALRAGGRTVAVMGTGIDKIYPAENRRLAARIPEDGALVSQFWPGAPPRRQNFPLRNVVTSGIAVGTVVIEASATSGAKMQARLALEHGKSLFLVEDLVMHEEWARRYAHRRGALVVRSVDDVLAVLDGQRQDVVELQLF